MSPQLADDRLYFVSDLAGRLSLFAMDAAGSVPEPLLPPGIALQNPELVGGHLFYVLPDHGRILLMLDEDGDENYEPSLIPLEAASRSRSTPMPSAAAGRTSSTSMRPRASPTSWPSRGRRR